MFLENVEKKTNKKIIPDFSINFIAMSPEPRITIKQMWNHPNNASKMGINLKMGESTTIKKCPKMVDLTIKHG